MSLIRWRPYRGLTSVYDDVNRFLGDVVTGGSCYDGQLFTPLDVSETENEIVIRTDLPGVTREEIDISLEDGILTISGERRHEQEEENTEYHRQERVYGSFSRSLSLPRTIDPEHVTGTFKDGVLTVTVGKREETKPRQIKVDVH